MKSLHPWFIDPFH